MCLSNVLKSKNSKFKIALYVKAFQKFNKPSLIELQTFLKLYRVTKFRVCLFYLVIHLFKFVWPQSDEDLVRLLPLPFEFEPRLLLCSILLIENDFKIKTLLKM